MFQDVLDGFMLAVEVGVLVEEPDHASLGARPVVADEVEDQRVVELTGRLDRPDQPADLGVGVLAEPREHFHLAGEELLFIGAQRGPVS